MSETKSPGGWDSLWKEYTNSLEKWREVFESFQKITNEMQTKYNEVMEKASSESGKDSMQEFGQNWQKAMNEAGITAFKQFGENWQKAMDDYSVNAFKQFSESWQKSMSESGLESMKTYGEMMNKFVDTWKKMWQGV